MKKIIFAIIILLVAGVVLFRFLPKSPDAGLDQNGMKTGASIRIPDSVYSFTPPAGWDVVNVEAGVVVMGKGAKGNPESAPISIDVSGSLPYEKAVEEITADLESISKQDLTVVGLKGIEISGRIKGSVGEEAGAAVRYTMLDQAGRLVSIDLAVDSPENREIYYHLRDSLVRENPI